MHQKKKFFFSLDFAMPAAAQFLNLKMFFYDRFCFFFVRVFHELLVVNFVQFFLVFFCAHGFVCVCMWQLQNLPLTYSAAAIIT